MGHVLFAVLVIGACLVQVSVLAAYPIMPELPLALAAWAMVGSSERGLVARAWAVGFTYDLMDPGSQWFHAVAYVGLALACLPVRQFLFRRRIAAWAMWAAVCTVAMAAIDACCGSRGDTNLLMVVAEVLLTASAAVLIGWMLAIIPASRHPLGMAGA